MLCNILEVDVNGQETFFVDSMEVLAFFSGKLRKIFGNSTESNTTRLKLILHDFPGGAEGFELIVRFCYSRGKIDISPSNALLLHASAEFLEINEEQTKKYFDQSIHLWTWFELLDCLKQGQKLQSFMNNSSYLVQKILHALVEKIYVPNISSPVAFSCSDDSSSIHFSGDTSTNYSSRFSNFQSINWLRDLEFLNIFLFEKLVSTMISQKVDHEMVFSFIIHYYKLKFVGVLQTDHQKCKIIEIVINTLCSFDGSFNFPFRSLFDMLQICLRSKMGKCLVKKVERMIGYRLDEATLDDLLIRSPREKGCAYDVSLILRLLKIFLGQRRKMFFVRRLMKVGLLMDLYLAEVSPDPHLKPHKFVALAVGLPDLARVSYDRVFEVIDIYFKVHKFISEEEKMKICSVLNYDKLSTESLMSIAKNVEFPASAVATALVFLQSKVKISSFDVKNLDLSCNSSLSAIEDEEIIVHLSKGKECRKVQKNSAIASRINVTCPTNGKSLPRLCS